MPCFICKRGNCQPQFHGLEEQRAFDRAEAAYEKYLEAWEQCRREYEGLDSDDDDEGDEK